MSETDFKSQLDQLSKNNRCMGLLDAETLLLNRAADRGPAEIAILIEAADLIRAFREAL